MKPMACRRTTAASSTGYREGPYRRLMDGDRCRRAIGEHPQGLSRKRAIQLDPAQCHCAGAPAITNPAAPSMWCSRPPGRISRSEPHRPGLAEVDGKARCPPTTFWNGHTPRCLRNLPNAIHLPMMEWEQLSGLVAENRFHAAIAPALDTPFNRARSISKLHDHAAYGAAGIYTIGSRSTGSGHPRRPAAVEPSRPQTAHAPGSPCAGTAWGKSPGTSLPQSTTIFAGRASFTSPTIRCR